MSDVFRGEVTQRVDSKGRVLIPVAFRRILEAGDPQWAPGGRPKFVIVYGDPRRSYVECHSITGMQGVEAKILGRPLGDPVRKLLSRHVITLSVVAEIDDDGRIVLPQKVREKLGLSPEEPGANVEVILAGATEVIQIWERATYDRVVREKDADDLADLPPEMDLMSLLSDAAPRA